MKGCPRGLEKNNLVPVHKKERKDLMKTCRPISFHSTQHPINHRLIIIIIMAVGAWCPLKVRTYFNKAAADTRR